MAKIRTDLERRLYETLRRTLHYAGCLETECANLGNAAVRDPRNTSLQPARDLIAEIREA